MLEKGHKLSHGGKRPGAGAKPKKFKTFCKRIVGRKSSQQLIQDIIDGKEVDVKTHEGQVISLPAPAAVRADVLFQCADRAEGKPLPEGMDEDGAIVAGSCVVFLSPGTKGVAGSVVNEKST